MSTTAADTTKPEEQPKPSRLLIGFISAYLMAFSLFAGFAAYKVWPNTVVYSEEASKAEAPKKDSPVAETPKPVQPPAADASGAGQPPAGGTADGTAANPTPPPPPTAEAPSEKPVRELEAQVAKLVAALNAASGKCSTTACDARRERNLVMFVFYLGVLGACIHAMTSVTTYIGNRSFETSWTAWYLLRPVMGGVLAWIVFLVFRGGFLGQTPADTLNPFAFGALGALSGLFSKQVIDKLGELVDTVFRMPPDKGDGERSGKPMPGAPSIEDTDPKALSEATPNTPLTIIGKGFEAGCVVEIGGKPLNPSDVTATRLKLMVAAAIFAGKESVDIVVRLKGEKGKVSNAFSVKVTK